MANYNSGIKYNVMPGSGGARYNSAPFVFRVVIRDDFLFSDEITVDFGKYILSDGVLALDSSDSNAVYTLKTTVNIEDDDIKYSGLFAVAENMNVVETVLNQYASLFFTEHFNAFENGLFQLNEIIAQENLQFKELSEIEAVLNALDFAEFEDAYNVFFSIFRQENMNLTDYPPRTSESDFYVTKGEGGVGDVLMPFNLIIDYSRTNIDFMPEAEDTSVSIMGIDGEIVQDTVYKSRKFDIFAVSQDGLSLEEKEQIKKQIAKILNSVKKGKKILTFADQSTSFEVKYSGLASATNKPSWVDFEIPLKSESAYGYSQFVKSLDGSGLISNNGDKEIGVVIKIKGSITNPSFLLGDRAFTWNGKINANETLVIDTNTISCYKILSNNTKENAKKYLDGEPDKKIPIGSVALTISGNIESHFHTEWREMVLY